MVTEARLERVASGLAPGDARMVRGERGDAAWVTNAEWSGGVCIFESDESVLRGRPDLSAYEKPEAGFTLRVVPPGRPADIYHAESVQEDFLILAGEGMLIIEEEERPIRTWDVVHCPPMTAHTFVATGDAPLILIATGNRRADLERIYPRSDVALRRAAGSEVTTTQPDRTGHWEVRRPDDWDELPWTTSSG
jgi:uncharacterized cupin superfamily protein